MEADNIRVEHTLFAPFRILLELIKWLGLLGAVGGCLIIGITFNSFAWIFGMGSNGVNGRQEIADMIAMDEPQFGRLQILDMRTEVAEYHPGYSTDTDSYETPSCSAYLRRSISSTSLTPPQFGEDFSATKQPSAWYIRGQISFRRKTNVMNQAFVTGAAMSVRLHVALARLKRDGNAAVEKDVIDACEVGTDIKDSLDIVTLPDAPVVKNYQTLIPYAYAARKADGSDLPEKGIVGMCLMSDEICANPFHKPSYAVSQYGDLFDDTPVLKPEAEAARQALLAMNTDEFWIKEAHANGILDKDAEVAQLHSWAAGALARIYSAENHPPMPIHSTKVSIWFMSGMNGDRSNAAWGEGGLYQ